MKKDYGSKSTQKSSVLPYTKGNIPINNSIYQKYSNVKEIFAGNSNFAGEIVVKTHLDELESIDIFSMSSSEIKILAYNIFTNYHNKNKFINDGNIIEVNKSGINESIEKIFGNRIQRDFLKEHLLVFSCLGKIIEHAKLVSQFSEVKKRFNINYWNYYFDGLNIAGNLYSVVFDVRSLENGKNQYRVQRIEKKTGCALRGR